jgi:hypothetical protein
MGSGVVRTLFHSVLMLAVCSTGQHIVAEEVISFERDVAPILIRRCVQCHSDGERQGELQLHTEEGLLKGGESGVALSPDRKSGLLLERIEAGEMPPSDKGGTGPLPSDELSILKRWMAAGSPWPKGHILKLPTVTSSTRAGLDWWSLQPLRVTHLPTVKQTDRLTNMVDAYLLSRLEKEGMSYAPPADRRTLIRRLYADLLGLPPTYEEIESFANDPSSNAYEELVDRLLDSPHFGERWARYWLDLVRYAETSGYERDQVKPNAWKYRDWVIQAINDDIPYDQFIREQLAGDEIPERSEATLIATGFLRLGTWNDEPNDALEYKYERVEDLIHTTSTAFLGMTVKCARCHDHKFDPIPQVDYYKMAAIFWAGHVEPRGADLLGGPSKEELGADVLGYTDRSRDPPPLHRLAKGDPHREEEIILPGVLSFVPTLDRPIEPSPPQAKTTYRRRQLADWIADPNHPLTARVAVNRLWQHHFGQGLVRTPDNFGFTGDQPVHPELLDALARELIAGGWRFKRIHRLILLSQAYRQSVVHPNERMYREKDAANRLLWKANLVRRDAESLRDAMLLVSGRIDPKIGGPSFHPTISDDALEGLSMKGGAWKASPEEEQRRRSIYMFSKRSLLSPLMTVFDFCDTSQPCAKREVTTVAPQALALLNNSFVHQMSEATADRVIASGAKTTDEQIDSAWKFILGRVPSVEERDSSSAHLKEQTGWFSDPAVTSDEQRSHRMALASLCHVLMNSNEFVFVD